MRLFVLILSTVLLAGCMSKVETLETESGDNSNNADDAVVEEVELNEKQKEIIEKLPKVSSENALNNISKMYNYQHLAEREIKVQPPVPNATDRDGIVSYLAFGFSKYLVGNLNAKEFIELYELYLDESYLDLFGDNQDIRIKTMQTVYDTYYKDIPETKITGVFISNTIVSKTADDVIVAYRRHTLENGKEIFYEMGFTQNDKKEWLLIDDRVSINPYSENKVHQNVDEKEITPENVGEGE